MTESKTPRIAGLTYEEAAIILARYPSEGEPFERILHAKEAIWKEIASYIRGEISMHDALHQHISLLGQLYYERDYETVTELLTKYPYGGSR